MKYHDCGSKLKGRILPVLVLAEVIGQFTEQLGLSEFAIYVFDYGAPVGFRLMLRYPDKVTAIISQNGNAYVEGLSEGWAPIRAYWEDPSQKNRDALRSFSTEEITRWQYTHGVENAESRIAPEAIALDQALLDRPQSAEIQLDLFGDYKSNVALYPKFQEYFRTYRRPTLAVWGKNDPANGSSKQNTITPRKDELNHRSGPRSKSRNEVLNSRRTTLSEECFSWHFARPTRAKIGEERRSFSNRIHRS